MDRRKFVLATVVLPVYIPGCFPIMGFLRVAVGRGLLRNTARAGRGSRKGTAASFGRVGTTALQLYRLQRMRGIAEDVQSMGGVCELGENDLAMNVKSSETLSECFVRGASITTSRVDGPFIEHYSHLFDTSVGYSKPVNDRVVRHYAFDDSFLGEDEIATDSGSILHFDENRDLVGKTEFVTATSNHPLETVVSVNNCSFLAEEIERTTEMFRDDVISGIVQGNARMQEAQDECLAKEVTHSCREQSIRAQRALEEMESRYS